ncbi:hypothetical protein [Corynebacterium heidelbergense]|uniref:Uncharacterized protein n=1 Tax=Corynebacterium heidelbergense TaxID=2055947 RepID=A0A364VEE3_9CORY|nr:hypothetical protein [Corynebacterium heidelbergense]RAV35032.1 hypothetical protein CWC39_00220 [Corynebacterium heidelbergense]WCZ37419.1 Deoxyribose-phosphate aldolase [Corynebacterium heidelbergense]
MSGAHPAADIDPARVDLMALSAGLGPAGVGEVVRLAATHDCGGIGVWPSLVPAVVAAVAAAGCSDGVGTPPTCAPVIGLPFGRNHSLLKATEARFAVEQGADRVEVIADWAAVAAGDTNAVLSEILTLREAVPPPVELALVLPARAVLEAVDADEEGSPEPGGMGRDGRLAQVCANFAAACARGGVSEVVWWEGDVDARLGLGPMEAQHAAEATLTAVSAMAGQLAQMGRAPYRGAIPQPGATSVGIKVTGVLCSAGEAGRLLSAGATRLGVANPAALLAGPGLEPGSPAEP